MTSRRVTVVASELLGRAGTGGAGTADSLLAVALGRHGHDVELLIASGRHIGELSPEWMQTYEEAGVHIRVLDRMRGVRPEYLAPTLEVFHALREQPPEVSIVNDWRGLGYAALRARQLGRGLESTAFIVHCHGPGRVLAEFAQKVPDTIERFGEEVTERASVELADAVVSPSEWLLDWMRAHRWPVPEAAQVIQYVRQPASTQAPAEQQIRRLAFFGQLREGKGIRIFLDALDELDPIDVVFLGSESKRWTRDAIAARAPGARIETALTREAALQELTQPGTLAVMPSLLDNLPNTVSECIEHAVPFVSTNTGGIPELVAESDRARVLCDPTSAALASRLRQALQQGTFAPARAAREPGEALDAWLQLVDSVSPAVRRGGRRPLQVSVVTRSERSGARAHNLAAATRSVEVEVVEAPSRETGLKRTAGDWVVFLEDDDIPDDGFIDALVDAQVTSQADVVTAAVRPSDDPTGIQLFLGDPCSLGLVENQYGVVGLVRSELAAAESLGDDGPDPDWLLFARLALAGAHVVSLPEPLSEHTGEPGRVGDVPGEGLAVLEAFEEAGVRPDLPQLAATLAAASRRLTPSATANSDGGAPTGGRLRGWLRPARFVPWARSSND
jgi:glycosyltransferase involved in cell wall biosynthesis